MEKFFTPKEKKPVTITALLRLHIITLMILITANAFAQNDAATSNRSINYLSAVNLDQFTGGYSSGFVQLKWVTTNQTDISHFEVERSTDGTNFRQIGRIMVKGDNDSKMDYSYLDILAEKGANFYRLVVIDKDGNISYSKAITIGVEKGISLFVVYPNPFGKKVQVKFNSDYQDQVVMRIINEMGAVVRSQTDAMVKGENLITIKNVDDLPPGGYFLELITKDRKLKTRLMKLQTE